MQNYELWCKHAVMDDDLVKELKVIEGKEDEIFDRFYRELEFGTAGLRGVLGAGTNRMNIYTVGRATQGFCDCINKSSKNPSVAIGFDSRIKSDVFAKRAAEIFAANGIKVHIFRELEPTPLLSYAIRQLKCDAGIIVTASHNPAKYNGYKAYGSDGCQIGPGTAKEVLDAIASTDIFSGVLSLPFDEGLAKGMIEYISDDVVDNFLKDVYSLSVDKSVTVGSDIKVVYTPLNGAGNKPVRKMFEMMGIENVIIVPEQEHPDGNFPTCSYPNPEEKDALKLGLELCRKENADLLIATDPDCDRVGIAVRDGDDYTLLTGNEVGVLMLDYIASGRQKNGTLRADGVAVQSIVSTEMSFAVAANYGVELRQVLTGFKFIGEQISLLEDANEGDRFILAFEESYGYVAGTHVRDKDAVFGSMMICEMACYHKRHGKSLADAMRDLYDKYGYYKNVVENYAFEGAAGMEKMTAIMSKFRTDVRDGFIGRKLLMFSDYKAGTCKDMMTGTVSTINLPSSDVLYFGLEGGVSFIVRPSGTEPKIKVYYTAKAESMKQSEGIIKELSGEVKELLN